MAAQGQGRKIHLRLFLEGVEVPVIGATVSGALGAGASANIQVVPTDRAMELKPRTLVHLFYWDEGVSAPTGSQVKEEDWGLSDVGHEYRLMFCGEIVSMGVNKQPGGRSVTFQCLDTSSYWDTTYQYMLNTSKSDAFVEKPAAFLGASDNLFNDLVNDPAQVMSRMLSQSPKTPDLQNATGLLGGVIRVLESVGGIPGIEAGANVYNTIAEMRIKNTHQLGAIEDDHAAEELFEAKTFENWLMGELGGMGDLITFRDVIGLFNSHTFHNTVPITTPRYILGKRMVDDNEEDDDPAAERVATGTVEEELVAQYKNCTPDLAKRVVQLASRLSADPYHLGALIAFESAGRWSTTVLNQSWPGGIREQPPPRTWATGFIQFTPYYVHHLSPLKAKVTDRQRSSLKWDKTLYAAMSIQGRVEYLANVNKAREEVSKTISELGVDGQFELMESYFTTGAGKTGTQWSLANLAMKVFSPSMINKPETTKFPDYITEANRSIVTVGDYVDKIRKLLVPGRGGEQVKTREAKSFADKRKSARLITQVIRPDVWFVAPPKCNVIFPEQQLNVSYSRNYMREVSRLQLRTNLKILGAEQDALLEHFDYAPRVDEFKEQFESDAHLTDTFLMNHERFTGIIPRFERMGEVEFRVDERLRETRASRGLSSDAEALRKNVADFNFFRLRFSSRNMEVGCYFNPYLALGFPGVVIQRGFTRPPGMSVSDVFEKIQESVSGFELNGSQIYLPTAMIGLISSLNHSVSQQGGTTQASFTQVRAHRTADGSDDDFLNIFIGARERAVEGGERSHHFTEADVADSEIAVSYLYVTSVPVGVSESISQEDLDDAARALTQNTGPDKGTIVAATAGDGYFRMSPPFLPTGLPSTHDPEHDAIFMNSLILTEKVTYTEEEKAAFATTEIKTPVEAALFPPWFSEVYYNDQIGEKVYTPLFGTGAIVDDQVFQVGKTKLAELRKQDPVTVTLTTTGGDGSSDGTAKKEKEETETISIEQDVSIAQAIDALATIYGFLKSADGALDVTKFIQRYTFRPVARLEEVLGSLRDVKNRGSEDLEFSSEGKLTKGREGFHSRAVAYLSGLKGLTTDPKQEMTKVSGGLKVQLNPDMDPRKARRDKVLSYRAELLGRLGDLGRGLEG